jgi:alkylation response protein AidB-like acyl-CoA dehydrogenase
MDMHHSQEAHAEIREEVRKLCARFPGEYWRELDTRRGYPTEFVKALTDAGWLAALIPEDFGGSGLPPRFWKKSTPRAAMLPPVTRKCTSWAPS